MPIGKNAIKRVENNGYSKVATSAPDMENSKVIEPTPAKTEPSPAKKPAAKRTPAAKKPTAKKAEKTVAKKNGFEKVSFGADLPYWLL